MEVRTIILWSLGMALPAVLPGIAAAQSAPKPALQYPWQPEEPQGAYPQAWHDGFRAGATAANQDLDQRVKASPDRHSSFTHPDLAPVASDDFQAGFTYAYEAVVQHRFNPAAGTVPHYTANYDLDYGPY